MATATDRLLGAVVAGGALVLTVRLLGPVVLPFAGLAALVALLLFGWKRSAPHRKGLSGRQLMHTWFDASIGRSLAHPGVEPPAAASPASTASSGAQAYPTVSVWVLWSLPYALFVVFAVCAAVITNLDEPRVYLYSLVTVGLLICVAANLLGRITCPSCGHRLSRPFNPLPPTRCPHCGFGPTRN